MRQRMWQTARSPVEENLYQLYCRGDEQVVNGPGEVTPGVDGATDHYLYQDYIHRPEQMIKT